MQPFFQAFHDVASALFDAAILASEEIDNNVQSINSQALFHNVITIGAIAFAAFALFKLSLACALVSGTLFVLRYHVGEILNTRISKMKNLFPDHGSQQQRVHGGNYIGYVFRRPIFIDVSNPWRP